jgi:hypothetical protein
MTEFCRCDNPTVVDDVCINGGCGKLNPGRLSVTAQPADHHHVRARALEEKPPWRICPECGVENTEHNPACSRSTFRASRYVPGKLAVFLLSFAMVGQWVTTPAGDRVCQLRQPIARGMTLQVDFCENWQPGFRAPQRADTIPFRDGWARNPRGDGLQIHVEGEGWVP